MKKTGRPLWKKIMAFVCVLTVCVTAAQWPIGKARAAATVYTIYLTEVDGGEWTDGNGVPLSLWFDANDNTHKDSGYKYESMDGKIKVTMENSQAFSGKVTFKLSASLIPESVKTEGIISQAVTRAPAQESGIYAISVSIGLASSDPVTLTPVIPKPTFNITYDNANSNYFTYKLKPTSVKQDESFKFQIVETNPLFYNLKFSLNDVTPLEGKRKDSEGNDWDETKGTLYSYTEYEVTGVNEASQITWESQPRTFKATFENSSGNGYNVRVSSGNQNAINYGGSLRFRINLDPGYEISGTPEIEGGKGAAASEGPAIHSYNTSNNEWEIENITADIKIKSYGTIQKKSYKVSFIEGDNYEISFDEGTSYDDTGHFVSVSHGNDLSFKVKPATGYKITSVKAGTDILRGASVSESSEMKYTLNNVQENKLVEISVAEESYSVTYKADGLDPAYKLRQGSNTVKHGADYSFSIETTDGYQPPTVMVQVGDAPEYELTSSSDSYTIYNVQGNLTIKVTGNGKKSYNVNFSTGAGYHFVDDQGSTIESPKSVVHGEALKFKVVVDAAYKQSESAMKVTVGGIEAQKDGEFYTTGAVTESKTVTVTDIKKNTYNITLIDGSDASYTFSTTNLTSGVEDGSVFRFKVNLGTGYVSEGDYVFDVQVKDGTSESTSIQKDAVTGEYYFTVAGNTTIKIISEVKAITFKATQEHTSSSAGQATAVAEGTDNTDMDALKYGKDFSFRVQITESETGYYEVTQVAVNGVPYVDVDGVYTVSNVTSDLKIQITTRAIPLTVTFVDNVYNYGDTKTYIITDLNKKDDTGRYITLSDPECKSKVYGFDGWYKESQKVDKIREEDIKNGPLTLIAHWKLIAGESSNVTVTTGGVAAKEKENKYIVAYDSNINFTEIDEEYGSAVTITGFGTIYARASFDPMNYADRIKERNKNQKGVEQQAILDDNTRHYYTNLETPIPVGSLGSRVGFMLSQYFEKAPGERWGAGWVELTVHNRFTNADETILVVAKVKKVEKYVEPASVMQEISDAESEPEVIDAVPTDAQTPAIEGAVSEGTPAEIEQPTVENAPENVQTPDNAPAETPQEIPETPADTEAIAEQ